jgi:hypothetical protein
MKKFTHENVLEILFNNGIDDDYFESMGGKEIELGSEEWMDVLSDVVGFNVYEKEIGELGDLDLVSEFMGVLEEMEIELV